MPLSNLFKDSVVNFGFFYAATVLAHKDKAYTLISKQEGRYYIKSFSETVTHHNPTVEFFHLTLYESKTPHIVPSEQWLFSTYHFSFFLQKKNYHFYLNDNFNMLGFSIRDTCTGVLLEKKRTTSWELAIQLAPQLVEKVKEELQLFDKGRQTYYDRYVTLLKQRQQLSKEEDQLTQAFSQKNFYALTDTARKHLLQSLEKHIQTALHLYDCFIALTEEMQQASLPLKVPPTAIELAHIKQHDSAAQHKRNKALFQKNSESFLQFLAQPGPTTPVSTDKEEDEESKEGDIPLHKKKTKKNTKEKPTQTQTDKKHTHRNKNPLRDLQQLLEHHYKVKQHYDTFKKKVKSWTPEVLHAILSHTALLSYAAENDLSTMEEFLMQAATLYTDTEPCARLLQCLTQTVNDPSLLTYLLIRLRTHIIQCDNHTFFTVFHDRLPQCPLYMPCLLIETRPTQSKQKHMHTFPITKHCFLIHPFSLAAYSAYRIFSYLMEKNACLGFPSHYTPTLQRLVNYMMKKSPSNNKNTTQKYVLKLTETGQYKLKLKTVYSLPAWYQAYIRKDVLLLTKIELYMKNHTSHEVLTHAGLSCFDAGLSLGKQVAFDICREGEKLTFKKMRDTYQAFHQNKNKTRFQKEDLPLVLSFIKKVKETVKHIDPEKAYRLQMPMLGNPALDKFDRGERMEGLLIEAVEQHKEKIPCTDFLKKIRTEYTTPIALTYILIRLRTHAIRLDNFVFFTVLHQFFSQHPLYMPCLFVDDKGCHPTWKNMYTFAITDRHYLTHPMVMAWKFSPRITRYLMHHNTLLCFPDNYTPTLQSLIHHIATTKTEQSLCVRKPCLRIPKIQFNGNGMYQLNNQITVYSPPIWFNMYVKKDLMRFNQIVQYITSHHTYDVMTIHKMDIADAAYALGSAYFMKKLFAGSFDCVLGNKRRLSVIQRIEKTFLNKTNTGEKINTTQKRNTTRKYVFRKINYRWASISEALLLDSPTSFEPTIITIGKDFSTLSTLARCFFFGLTMKTGVERVSRLYSKQKKTGFPPYSLAALQLFEKTTHPSTTHDRARKLLSISYSMSIVLLILSSLVYKDKPQCIHGNRLAHIENVIKKLLGVKQWHIPQKLQKAWKYAVATLDHHILNPEKMKAFGSPLMGICYNLHRLIKKQYLKLTQLGQVHFSHDVNKIRPVHKALLQCLHSVIRTTENGEHWVTVQLLQDTPQKHHKNKRYYFPHVLITSLYAANIECITYALYKTGFFKKAFPLRLSITSALDSVHIQSAFLTDKQEACVYNTTRALQQTLKNKEFICDHVPFEETPWL